MNKAKKKEDRKKNQENLFDYNTVNSAAALSFMVHEPSGIIE